MRVALALVDQTRGLLKYINDNFPSGYTLYNTLEYI